MNYYDIDPCININLPLTGRWPNSKVTYRLTEALLLILQSVSQLLWKVKVQHEILTESNISISVGKTTTTTTCPTTPTLFTMHQLNWNVKFGRDLDFIRQRDICTTVWPYVRSVEQLLSTAVARQIWKLTWWNDTEKTTWVTRSLWMLTLVTLQLAQARTRRTTTWLLKTFSSHNFAANHRGRVITESIAHFFAKDLQPYSVESDGFWDMVR